MLQIFLLICDRSYTVQSGGVDHIRAIVMPISIKITDATGRILSAAENATNDQSALLAKAEAEVSKYIRHRVFPSLIEDLHQPLTVTWSVSGD